MLQYANTWQSIWESHVIPIRMSGSSRTLLWQGLSLCNYGCMVQEAISTEVWGLMLSVYWYLKNATQETVYMLHKVHTAYTAAHFVDLIDWLTVCSLQYIAQQWPYAQTNIMIWASFFPYYTSHSRIAILSVVYTPNVKWSMMHRHWCLHCKLRWDGTEMAE